MHRLLFADDEKIVREGVSSRVEWERNGFELAAVVTNGREILDYLEENAVDVILTDISMPLLDGLAVCREVSKRFPRVMLLLLTGYDQFEYAQEALKYQVYELLLKPITADELAEVLKRVRDELDRREQDRSEQEQLRTRLADAIPLLKASFLQRLVLGQLAQDVIEKRSGDLGFTDLGAFYQILIINVPAEWEEIHRVAMSETARTMVLEHDDFYINHYEDIVLLLQGLDSDKLGNRTRDTGKRLVVASGRISGNPVAAATGDIVEDLDRLRWSYDGARRALIRQQLLGLPQLVSASEMRDLDTLQSGEFQDAARQLVDHLRRADREQVAQTVDQLFTLLEHHYLEPEELDAYLVRVRFLLLDFAREITRSSANELPHNISGQFASARHQSLTGAKETYRKIVTAILDHLESEKESAVRARIRRAEQSIRERYVEPGLSLQEICDEVFLSVSQFSVLFKDATGRTFVEYLTEVRIDQAKRLLRTTSLKTYEIAEAVGYRDPRYFTYVFKKMTGQTSSEYRAGEIA